MRDTSAQLSVLAAAVLMTASAHSQEPDSGWIMGTPRNLPSDDLEIAPSVLWSRQISEPKASQPTAHWPVGPELRDPAASPLVPQTPAISEPGISEPPAGWPYGPHPGKPAAPPSGPRPPGIPEPRLPDPPANEPIGPQPGDPAVPQSGPWPWDPPIHVQHPVDPGFESGQGRPIDFSQPIDVTDPYAFGPPPTETVPSDAVAKERSECSNAIAALGDPKQLIDTPLTDQSYFRDRHRDIEQFDRACLTSTDDDSVPGMSVAAKAAGVLTYHGRPFCGAMLVGSRHVITARHCFRGRETGVPQCPSWLPTTGGRCNLEEVVETLQFVALESDSKPLKVSPDSVTRLPNSPFGHVDDYVLLELAEPAGYSVQVTQISSPADTALWLAGPFAVSLLARGLDPAQAWRSGIRWSKTMGRHCRVVEQQSGGCTFHRCQSLAEFSGAPLVASAKQETEGRIQVFVAGLHVGSAQSIGRGTPVPSCDASDHSSANVGVVLSDIKSGLLSLSRR